MKIKGKIREDRTRRLLIEKAEKGLLSTKVRRHGNSHYVLIPAVLLDAIGLKGNMLSMIIAEQKRLVLMA